MKSTALIIFLFCPILLWAQQDSSLNTYILDTTYVSSTSFSEGYYQKNFSSKELQVYQGKSLAQVLDRETNVFVKQYGLGNLASLSARGGNAAHTAILWEGISLVNPMLGQTDLNLLPLLFVDELQWQAGASSAQNGNYALGGSLQLQSHSAFNQGWIGWGLWQMGSFGQQSQQFRLNFSNSKYAGSFRAYYQKATNDYKYIDLNAFGNPKPKLKQQNAFQEQAGFLQENRFQFGPKNLVQFKLWGQNSYRQLPPSLLQNNQNSEEEQWDASFRTTGIWQYLASNFQNKVQAALSFEKLDYNSLITNSQSNTVSALWLLEQKWNIEAPVFQQKISWSLQQQYQQVRVSTYLEKAQEVQSNLLLSYQLINPKKWIYNISFRQPILNTKLLRPSFSNNLLIQFPKQQIDLKAAISYNYRIPSFNDRYWPILGRIDLKPEYALATEVQAIWGSNKKPWQLRGTVYSNWVENWIMWTPESNSGLWRPTNLALVWARGLELDFRYGANFAKKSSWELGGSYQFSPTTRPVSTDPQQVGKQLIYTPLHSLSAFAKISLRHFEAYYRHLFYSKRFLDNYNSEALPSYQLGFLQLSYALQTADKQVFRLQLSIDNIGGSNYQVVANRPMPLRQIQVGLSMSF